MFCIIFVSFMICSLRKLLSQVVALHAITNCFLNLHKFSLVYHKNRAQVLLGRSSSRNKQKKRETTRNYFSIINLLTFRMLPRMHREDAKSQ